MVKRATYQESFKQVAMPQDTGEARAVAGLAKSVGALIQTKQKQDELKITNYSSQADLDMLNATSEYRNKMALDPMDTEAQEKLKTDYDKIFAQYDNKIGVNAKGKWNQTKNILKQQYATANGKWILAQNIKNGERNLSEGIESSLKKGYISGIEGDYQTAMESAGLKELQLRESADGLVPQDQLEEDMKNFKSDYARNFVLGALQSSPSKAEDLLADPGIVKTIDSPDAINDLNKAIKTRKAELSKIGSQVKYDSQKKFEETSKDMPIGDKLGELEQGVKSGRYDSKWAEAKKESALSAKGVNAKTQNEYLNRLVMRSNDLQESFDKKGSNNDTREYMEKVNKISIDIEKGKTRGLLDESDANNVYKNLYDQTTAKATAKLSKDGSWFRYGYANANTSFKNGLNDTSRTAEALREYFGKTVGQKYDRKTYIEISDEIIDRYNTQTMNGLVETAEDVKVDTKASESINSLLDSLGAD